jgi:hypothetical protein
MSFTPFFSWVMGGVLTIIGFAFYEHTHSVRWNVKTLADTFTCDSSCVTTTISEQRALRPPMIDESMDRQHVERTTYRLRAYLYEVGIEDDGDYHLVIEEPKTGLQMVAEIPQPTAQVPKQYLRAFYDARRVVDSLIGHRPDYSLVASRPLIEITGVGFFDEPHAVTPKGMAPNFREIHPVLTIRPVNDAH